MVLDFKRHCHYSYMKMWQGSDDLVYGRWHRAPPDAVVFEGESEFRARITWNRGEEITGVGEQRDLPHPYYKGQNPLHYPGRRHCGSDNAMRFGGIVGTDPPITTDTLGYSACCETPPPVGAIGGQRQEGNLPVAQVGLSIGLTGSQTHFLVVYRLNPSPSPVQPIAGWTLNALFTYSGPAGLIALYRKEFDDLPPGHVFVDELGDESVSCFNFVIPQKGITRKAILIGQCPPGPIGTGPYSIPGIAIPYPEMAVLRCWFVHGTATVTSSNLQPTVDDWPYHGVHGWFNYTNNEGPGVIAERHLNINGVSPLVRFATIAFSG